MSNNLEDIRQRFLKFKQREKDAAQAVSSPEHEVSRDSAAGDADESGNAAELRVSVSEAEVTPLSTPEPPQTEATEPCSGETEEAAHEATYAEGADVTEISESDRSLDADESEATETDIAHHALETVSVGTKDEDTAESAVSTDTPENCSAEDEIPDQEEYQDQVWEDESQEMELEEDAVSKEDVDLFRNMSTQVAQDAEEVKPVANRKKVPAVAAAAIAIIALSAVVVWQTFSTSKDNLKQITASDQSLSHNISDMDPSSTVPVVPVFQSHHPPSEPGVLDQIAESAPKETVPTEEQETQQEAEQEAGKDSNTGRTSKPDAKSVKIKTVTAKPAPVVQKPKPSTKPAKPAPKSVQPQTAPTTPAFKPDGDVLNFLEQAKEAK